VAISASSASSGMTPASESFVAFTTIMYRMVVSQGQGPRRRRAKTVPLFHDERRCRESTWAPRHHEC